jgi:hypothetical protein
VCPRMISFRRDRMRDGVGKARWWALLPARVYSNHRLSPRISIAALSDLSHSWARVRLDVVSPCAEAEWGAKAWRVAAGA